MDDWLISPQMKFTEPGVYRLVVNMKYSDNSTTDFDILFGSGASIGGYTDVLKNYTKIPTTAADHVIYFVVEEAGEYGFAFHAKGDSSWNTFCIYNISVEKWKTTPAQVSDLKTVVNDDDSVTLTWTHPTTTNLGTELTSLTKTEIYCNNELVATHENSQPGETDTFTHSPEGNGVFTYHVLPYNEEGVADGEPTKVTTTWVGDETQTLPYTTEFKKTDVSAPIWSGYDANNDGHCWTLSQGTTSGMFLAKPAETTRVNDYLLSPYFELQEGYYNISYSIQGAGKNFSLQIGLVSDKKNVTETFESKESFKLPGNSYGNAYPYVIKIEKAGKYAIALYSNDYLASTDYALGVTKFVIEYKPIIPTVATDLAVVPDPDRALEATLTWKNPTTSNIEGAVPQILKAEVRRGNDLIATLTEGLVAGETSTYVDTEVPEAGEYTYSVKIYGEGGASTANPASIKSTWIGGGMSTPWGYNATGFKDGLWTIHNVNGNTNTWGPITWEVYNYGIGITDSSTTINDWVISAPIEFKLGTYILSTTSYYSSGYSAVKWDIHLGTSSHYDDMDVKVATVNTSNPMATQQTDSYKIVVLSELPQNPQMKVNPSDYDGLDMTFITPGIRHIGLHANEPGGFLVKALTVSDNIYTGIEGVEDDENLISVKGDSVRFGAAADSAVIYDLRGVAVAGVANASSISIANLEKGIYVLSAEINGKVITKKINK